MNGVLEFVDTSDMTVMTPPQEHFMCTDVEWDPTGRYVTTAVSWWGHKVSVRLVLSTESKISQSIIYSLNTWLLGYVPPTSWLNHYAQA